MSAQQDAPSPEQDRSLNFDEAPRKPWYRVDDFLAMGLGVFIIAVAATSALIMRPENTSQLAAEHQEAKVQVAGSG